MDNRRDDQHRRRQAVDVREVTQTARLHVPFKMVLCKCKEFDF
jgi:hypothetical protein